MAAKFLPAVLAQPKVKRLISSDHFSVDGTLIEAWAKQPKVPAIRRIAGKAAEGSIKSFRRKDGGDDDPRRGSTRRATVSRPGFAISAIS